jgi:hypothetical protein
MTTTEPTDDSAYPRSWRPKSAPPERNIDAEIDDYVRNLSDREFQSLVFRTRRQHP